MKKMKKIKEYDPFIVILFMNASNVTISMILLIIFPTHSRVISRISFIISIVLLILVIIALVREAKEDYLVEYQKGVNKYENNELLEKNKQTDQLSSTVKDKHKIINSLKVYNHKEDNIKKIVKDINDISKLIYQENQDDFDAFFIYDEIVLDHLNENMLIPSLAYKMYNRLIIQSNKYPIKLNIKHERYPNKNHSIIGDVDFVYYESFSFNVYDPSVYQHDKIYEELNDNVYSYNKSFDPYEIQNWLFSIIAYLCYNINNLDWSKEKDDIVIIDKIEYKIIYEG